MQWCTLLLRSYCITVWRGVLHFTARGEDLQKLHVSIVRNLFCEFSDPNDCLFRSNSILKLADVYRYCVSVYMYKMLKLDSCPTLLTDLDLRINNHDHNTRNRNNFVPPFPRVDNIRLNFKYTFPIIWNEIPTEIRDAQSLSCFKRKLNRAFLDTY